MGTPTVKETLQTFKVEHKKFENAHEMIQISMVGPIVNWKMVEQVRKTNEVDADSPTLLGNGSCGFHVLVGDYNFLKEVILFLGNN